MEKTQEEIIMKMVLDAWHTKVKRTDDLINKLNEEQLMNEIAPSRNRGIYLLGHLAAVHDRMLPLLGMGDSLYPAWYGIFVESPDKAIMQIPAANDIRFAWNRVNATLATEFNKLAFKDWLQKHNAVSKEDFSREPHRNKLNVIINRTNHLTSHLGQLVLLEEKTTQ